MSHSSFTILAAVYQLLSTASEEDLRATSERPDISPNIRKALLALAEEASRRSTPTVSRSATKGRAEANTKRLSAASGAERRAQSVRLLSDRRHFPDKAALARFARDIGLELKIDPKWGMPRAIRVIGRALADNPAMLARLDPENEQRLDPTTKGWMDIILGSK